MMTQDKARQIVHDYVKGVGSDVPEGFSLSDVMVVWWAKVLQNTKCMVTTTVPDGMYYELTYNGDKGEIYLDAYKKADNIVIAEATTALPVTSGIPIGGEHGRKCMVKPHPHGNQCHSTCPSCHGLAKY